MEALRTELHQTLKKILGSNNVYFQAPTGTKIQTPCIVYEFSGYDTKKANNKLYKKHERYLITLIHNRPDNTIKDSLLELPMCSFGRATKVDNLYHYYYDIFI